MKKYRDWVQFRHAHRGAALFKEVSVLERYSEKPYPWQGELLNLRKRKKMKQNKTNKQKIHTRPESLSSNLPGVKILYTFLLSNTCLED